MSIKGIIYDLDGTLVDTLQDLTDAMNDALSQCGCPKRTASQCRQMIGSGLRKYAQRALPEDRQDLTDQLLINMIEYYRDHCLDKTVPYDGIDDIIQKLASKGIRQGILTNKNQTPSELIVRHLFGDDLFNPIIGASDGRKVKPDPTTTLEILGDWQLSPPEVLYVGDSDVDIETARNAGVQCIACLWGFRSKQQLIDAGADILIDHPARIADYL